MEQVFTDQQADALAQEIDRQLAALNSLESTPSLRKGDSTDLDRYTRHRHKLRFF